MMKKFIRKARKKRSGGVVRRKKLLNDRWFPNPAIVLVMVACLVVGSVLAVLFSPSPPSENEQPPPSLLPNRSLCIVKIGEYTVWIRDNQVDTVIAPDYTTHIERDSDLYNSLASRALTLFHKPIPCFNEQIPWEDC